MDRSINLLQLTSACFPLLVSTYAYAQPVPTATNQELKSQLARDPGGHWTPETLARAQARDLPRPQANQDDFLKQSSPSADPAVAQVGNSPINIATQRNGVVPARDVEIRADIADRLFMPGSATVAPTSPPVPSEPVDTAAGTAGLYFSSSRLIPVDARLEFPFRTVGKLFYYDPKSGKDYVCSGAVIAPRLVLTAGHCVHSGSGGADGYFQRFLFVPAFHQGQAPYQAWNYTWAITTKSWMNSGSSVPNRSDLAILEVEDRTFGGETRTLGQVTGVLGYRTEALLPNHVKIVGYPVGFDDGNVMHQVDSGSHKAAAELTVLYGSDMTGGSSGGPWIENFGVRAVGQTGGINANPNRVVGVTSYGYTSVDPKVQGSSILGTEFLEILNAACRHRLGNC